MGMCVRVKRGLVVAGLLLGLGLFGGIGSTAQAAPADAGLTASSIVVQGNRRVEADTVRSYFKPGPGGRLDPAAIDAALKALYATGLFEDVHISQSGGKLIVTVVEAPVINRLAFEGNHRIKDEQLKQEIQSKERGSLSRAAVQADTQRIIEIYQRNGRFDVKVTPQIIDRPNNRVDLVFEINEGEKTGIKHIVFVGNNAYPAWRLKEVIKTSESNWLSFLQTDRRLRSRSHRGRPRSDPALLSQARLCRRSGRLGDRRIRSRAEGLHRHLHHRGGAGLPLRHRRHSIQCSRHRRGVAAHQPADGAGSDL